MHCFAVEHVYELAMYLDLLNRHCFPHWPEIFAMAESVMLRLQEGDREFFDHIKYIAQVEPCINPKVRRVSSPIECFRWCKLHINSVHFHDVIWYEIPVLSAGLPGAPDPSWEGQSRGSAEARSQHWTQLPAAEWCPPAGWSTDLHQKMDWGGDVFMPMILPCCFFKWWSDLFLYRALWLCWTRRLPFMCGISASCNCGPGTHWRMLLWLCCCSWGTGLWSAVTTLKWSRCALFLLV